MAYPSRGERVQTSFSIPVELHDWLLRTSRPGGPDSYCPAGRTVSDLVVSAIYLLRELRDGVPSPVSQELLDKALDDILLSNGGVWPATA